MIRYSIRMNSSNHCHYYTWRMCVRSNYALHPIFRIVLIKHSMITNYELNRKKYSTDCRKFMIVTNQRPEYALFANDQICVRVPSNDDESIRVVIRGEMRNVSMENCEILLFISKLYQMFSEFYSKSLILRRLCCN